MTKVRMSLAEAGAVLGIAPNSVRSRYKAGKLSGERDNSGRIWVWIDAPGSKISKNSIEPVFEGNKANFEADQNWLQKRLDLAEAELAELRPRVAAAEAEVTVLRDAVADARADRDAWRDQAQGLVQAPLQRKRWVLFGRG